MGENFFEFLYDKTLKQPKRLQNNVFALHLSERIKMQPGEYKKIDMKLSICLPEQIIIAYTVLPSFRENGLKLENCHCISTGNNIMNFNQLINLPWKQKFDLVNRGNNTTFSTCKKQELAFILQLNKGLEQLNVKYTETSRFL